MAFAELDPAEAALGKPVTAMSDTELVTYLKLAIKQLRGIDLAVDGYPERAVMAGLKRTYGGRAGQIVKWACVWHQGQYRNEVIGHMSFSKGRKWFTDILDRELQQHLYDEQQRHCADAKAQFDFGQLSDI
ncbi:hypothetical protein [Mycolicibacter kumamotonensis]|uniref:hypothetical protein n=1 Tax=Mycolicibacter kumamotonensis TaxID=354243 RepID=UPI0008065EA2|nr:hypothetical protein [Mycolicibacter kumamotonensis]